MGLQESQIKNYVKKVLTLLQEKQHFIQWGVFIVILIIGVFYSAYLGDLLRYSDEEQYVNIARNLVQKRIYSLDGVNPTAFRTPGYILPLAFLNLLGGGIFSYRMFNFFLLAVTAWIINKELSQRISKLAGSLSTLVFLSYPALIYLASTIYPQTLQLCLMSLLLLMGTRKDLKKLDFACLGLLSAWNFLTIPTTIFVVGILGVFWLKTGAKITDIMIAAIIVVVLAGMWSLRSSVAMNSLILVSTNSGINLLRGNSPNFSPNAGPTSILSTYTQKASDLNELDQDTYYRKQAFRIVSENPGRILKLYFLKVLNYFSYRNELATKSEVSVANDILMAITYYPLLILALLRLMISKKTPLSSLEILSVIIYFSNAFIGAIVFNRIRYRLPYDVLLMFLAVGLLVNILKSYSISSDKTKTGWIHNSWT